MYITNMCMLMVIDIHNKTIRIILGITDDSADDIGK